MGPHRMRRIRAAGAAAALVAAASIAGAARPAAAVDASVGINNFAFSPGSVMVIVGSSVHWMNNQAGVPHTVTADDGSFDSGRLASGQGFNSSFSQAGTFAYHCNIHPNMHGMVVVTGAAAPPTQAAAPTQVTALTQAAPPATTVASSGATTSAVAVAVPGRTVSLRAGYNLVGPPDGTILDASAVFAFDTTANGYRALDPGEATRAGQGYWVLLDADTSLQLSGGSNAAVTVHAAPGTWTLVGNPGGMLPALVSGADQVFIYDAVAGVYAATIMLQPGQGAWAYSARGGTITMTPGGTPAPVPTPSPSPSPTPPPTSVPVAAPVPRYTPQPVMPMPMPYPMPYPHY